MLKIMSKNILFAFSMSVFITGCSAPKKQQYLFGYNKPLCQTQVITVPHAIDEDERHRVILAFKDGIKRSYIAYNSDDNYGKNALACLKDKSFKHTTFEKKRILVNFGVWNLDESQKEKAVHNKKLDCDNNNCKKFSVSIQEIPRIVPPKYPKIAKHRKLEGKVVLAFDINEIGRAKNIKVITSPSKSLTRSAKKSLMRSILDTSAYDKLPQPYLQKARKTFIFEGDF